MSLMRWMTLIAGAAGLAMVSEIFASADPEAATRAAVTAWRDA